MTSTDENRLRADTERWFVRRGVPHFIADYSASEDIWTRATPFLAFVVFAELFLTFGDGASGWAQVLVFLSGVALIAAAFAMVNQLRGRSLFSPPEDIGLLELAAFVLVPAVLPQFNSRSVGTFAATVMANLVILGVTYVTVSYGLVPLIRWAIARFFKELSGLTDLLGKSLPLLLLFSAFLVLNAEMWQVAQDLPGGFLILVIGMVVLLGTAFVGLSLAKGTPAETGFTSWDEVTACCQCSPLADTAPLDPDRPVVTPPLDRTSRLNISLMQFVGVSIQVLLVASLVSAFYVIFGLLTVRETTIVQWIAADALDRGRDVYWEASLFGEALVLTRAHLVVAVFIGAFSGLQFAVSVLTDDTYREEFAADVGQEVRENLAVRALYLDRLVA